MYASLIINTCTTGNVKALARNINYHDDIDSSDDREKSFVCVCVSVCFGSRKVGFRLDFENDTHAIVNDDATAPFLERNWRWQRPKTLPTTMINYQKTFLARRSARVKCAGLYFALPRRACINSM